MASTAIVPDQSLSVKHDPSAKGFKLDGDVASPGNNMVYGTDGTGVKGWYSASGADGSETVIQAGSLITVTGSGTAGDPYVITGQAPDGSETVVTAGARVTVTGSGTSGDPYVITADAPAAPDGSETIVTAGARATVTGSGTSGDPYVVAADAPDGSETSVTAGANVTVTGTGTSGDPYVVAASAGGGGSADVFDDDSIGSASVEVTRRGGTATVFTNPSAGNYNLAVQAGAYIEAVDFIADNGDLDGSNQLILVLDNSANTRDRRFIVQVWDLVNNQMADLHAFGIVPQQSISGNITTLTFTNMNGFNNFLITLR